MADPERFPSGIPALADYVHKLGLKFGIYQVEKYFVIYQEKKDFEVILTMNCVLLFLHRTMGQRLALGETYTSFHFGSMYPNLTQPFPDVLHQVYLNSSQI